jgi:hypothetical protein
MFATMLDRLKFSASALIGLTFGIALAVPLFWIGVKESVGAMRQNAQTSFQSVLQREQDMSDQALRLQVLWAKEGVRAQSDAFGRVESWRSKLAGTGDFEDQIGVSEHLESALLDVGRLYAATMKESKKAAHSADCQAFARSWDPMLRYLVQEELAFTKRVMKYNAVLSSDPVPFVIGHKSFGSLVNALVGEVVNHLKEDLMQGLAWLKYELSLGWAKLRGATLPAPPAPLEHSMPMDEALFQVLPQPNYLAQAPLPEEDYPELQYDRQAPDMADVALGDEKVQLEEASVTPYAAVVPTIQKTASYH